jgi:Rrf2 family protein
MPAAKVTNRTNYAVRAVLYLSLQEPGCVVPIPEIATETGLSVKFLEEILLLLRTAGIVQSRRGKQGGYSLLRSPQELSVADVVQALEGEAGLQTEEEGDESQPFSAVTRAVFQSAAAAWWDELRGARLSDLAEEARRLSAEQSGVDMFHI